MGLTFENLYLESQYKFSKSQCPGIYTILSHHVPTFEEYYTLKSVALPHCHLHEKKKGKMRCHTVLW